jgi:O-acetylhomoserine (thiol)-lyase
MKKLNTRLIHGENDSSEALRSLKTPVYDAASFDFETAEAVEDAFTGRTDAYMYSRISNPTVRELEKRLKVLANAEDSLCVASGMAAISNVLLTICSAGDNIISSKNLFSNTFVMFSKTLPALGIGVKFVDLDNPAEIEAACDDRTRAVFVEVITNPMLKIYDMRSIAEVANRKKKLLIVDNSMLTPYIFPSGAWGADIEVMSTTKFVSGGATTIGGAVFTFPSDKWQYIPKIESEFKMFGNAGFFRKLSREIYRNVGACLAPHNAYIQLLGLETLTLRIDKICENALEVAEALSQTEGVVRVIYPSLKNNDYYPLALEQFGAKSGSLLGLELKDKEQCYRFMNALKVIRRGTNFCDNKSMIIHPASTMYADFSAADKAAMGITDGFMRLGVGLEDPQDILDDIRQALAVSAK